MADSLRPRSMVSRIDSLSLGTTRNSKEKRKESWLSAVATVKETLKGKKETQVIFQKASGEHTFQSLVQSINSPKPSGVPRWKLNTPNDLLPFLGILGKVSDMFLRTMAPSRSALYFFLGILRYTVEMAQQEQHHWQDLIFILKNVQQKLEKLEGATKWLDKNSDDSSEHNLLGDTISSTLLILLELFVETLAAMRKSPLGAFDENWGKTRDNALNRIGNEILHFNDLVTNQAELRNRSQPNESLSTENGIRFPLKVLPWPAYNGFFGREEILAEMTEKLGLRTFDQRGFGDIQSVLLHGTGGVGKTQIARAFAHRNNADFDAVFWVRSDTEVNIMADFTRIALSLNLPGASIDAQTNSWFIFSRWLHEQQSSPQGKRWLIIYDNCDNINDIYPRYTPTTKGSILITSRHNSAKLVDSIVLQVLPFDRLTGLKLMKRLLYHGKGGEDRALSPSEEKALEELLEKVDRLPLGVHVMVALMIPRINERGRHPIRDFCKYYEVHSRQLLTRAPRSTDYDRDADRPVGERHVLDNVWHLSFASLDEKAMSVLGMLSFFAPNDISISWFDLASKTIPPTHKVLSICKSVFEVECAVIELQGAALIGKDIDENAMESDSSLSSNIIITPNESISSGLEEGLDDSSSESNEGDNFTDLGINSAKVSLHRLVQEAVIYSRQPADRQAISDAAVRVMYEAFPKQEAGDTIELHVDTCSRLTPHILSLVRRHQEFGPSTENPLVPCNEMIYLLKHCIWYLYETGNDTTGLQLLQFAYDAIENVGMDKTTESFADFQYKAGSIYMTCGFLSKCRQVWEDARHILEVQRAAGSETAKRQLTWLLMAMGNLETADGNYEAALPLFSQSDKERLEHDKDNKWRHAIVNVNLGRLYSFMGDYETAMGKYEESEKGFGPKTYSMAIVDNLRGDVEFARGNIGQARNHYLSAIDCLETAGAGPIKIASYYAKLARLELSENNPELALKHIRKAFSYARRHAHWHGDQARILYIMSSIQRVLGKNSEADASARAAEEQRLKRKAILDRGGEVEKISWDGSEKAWEGLVCFFWR